MCIFYLPGTCLSSILGFEPSKRRPFPFKTTVIWVPGIYTVIYRNIPFLKRTTNIALLENRSKVGILTERISARWDPIYRRAYNTSISRVKEPQENPLNYKASRAFFLSQRFRREGCWTASCRWSAASPGIFAQKWLPGKSYMPLRSSRICIQFFFHGAQNWSKLPVWNCQWRRLGGSLHKSCLTQARDVLR